MKKNLSHIITIISFLFIVGVVPVHSQTAGQFVFTAAGDHGSGTNFTNTLTQIKNAGSSFHLAVGDNSYVQGGESTWCNKFNSNGLNAILITGNHDSGESGGGDIDKYITYPGCSFPFGLLPAGQKYGHQYYFDYPQGAPLVRFIMVRPGVTGKGEINYSVGQPGYQFVQNAITQARAPGSSIKWIVAGMHKNCITAGDKGACENQLGRDIFDLMVKEKIDLIIQGHDHNYQRSHALRCFSVGSFNASCIADSGSDSHYQKGAGSVVLIVGTGGKSLYPIRPSDAEFPYFATTDATTYGVAKFTVSSSQISVSSQFLRSAGGGFTDSFSISGSSTPPPTNTPGPSPVPTNTPRPPTATPAPSFSPALSPTPTVKLTPAPTIVVCSGVTPPSGWIPGDANQDRLVDESDYTIWKTNFGGAGKNFRTGDFNLDCKTDGVDFAVWLKNFSSSVNTPRPTQPAPSTQPSPTSGPTPTFGPSPTPGPSPFGYTQVDPFTQVDNYVNNFLKTKVQEGNLKVAATGAWWGDPGRFFENQAWVVNRDVQVGKVYANNAPVSQTFTCLLPGKTPGTGNAKNTLSLPNLIFQLGGHSGNEYRNYRMTSVSELGQWKTISISSHNQANKSHEFRTVCRDFIDNDPTSPFKGDTIRVNIDQMIWFGQKGAPGSGDANHDGKPFKYDFLDVHAWYDRGVNYAYGAIDGARDATREISTADLIGATVKGNLTVYGFAFVGGKSAGQTHHVELRIEQGGEDYTVARELHLPHETPIQAGNRRFSFTLDTTRLTNGLHILSWHSHVIDHRSGIVNRQQLAGEIKIPIYVQN